MNICTEQVFLVNARELDQQIQHTPTTGQCAFAMPMAVTAIQTEAQTSMCLPQSMGLSSRTQMCRLCATVTEMVVPIFQGEGLQNNLAEKIHQHLPIQVSEKDVLPVVMCFQCTSTLLAWHELVVCSVQADTAMRERFNLTCTTHQQEQQPREQSTRNQIKDEKWSVREARACVRCEHCAGQFPDTQLRAHLLAAHAALLYLCAECALYRHQGDMMAHMATHIEKANHRTNISEESTSLDTTKQAPRAIIPVVRIQRLPPNLTATPPPVETSPVTSPPRSAPAPAPAPLANDSPNTSSNSALQIVAHDQSPLQKMESNNVEETKHTDTVTDNIEPANVTVLEEQHASAANPGRTNDFSDHSDTENDFGRLPESVFDAIEDSQDAHSNEGSDKKVNLPRACPSCDKQCNSLSGWYYHLHRAHGGGARRTLACDTCHKVFVTKGELTTHARTHTKEKPFACGTCASVFASRAGRYIHEQTHSGLRAHACGRCPRAFRWRAQLRRHEARHAPAHARPHACPRCGRGFSVPADLARHVRAHDPGCHTCDICNATFKQKRYLKVHIENIHLGRTSADKQSYKKSKKMIPTSSVLEQDPSINRLSPNTSSDS